MAHPLLLHNIETNTSIGRLDRTMVDFDTVTTKIIMGTLMVTAAPIRRLVIILINIYVSEIKSEKKKTDQ